MINHIYYKGRPKRLIIPESIYFITCKTHHNYPYFNDRELRDIFIRNLKLTKYLKYFEMYAFSLLYDHFHMLVKPSLDWSISSVIKSLKQNVSRDINKQLSLTDTNQSMPLFRWQKSFFSHIIMNPTDYHNHVKYTVENHLKHGLPDSWEYNSHGYASLIDDFEPE